MTNFYNKNGDKNDENQDENQEDNEDEDEEGQLVWGLDPAPDTNTNTGVGVGTGTGVKNKISVNGLLSDRFEDEGEDGEDDGECEDDDRNWIENKHTRCATFRLRINIQLGDELRIESRRSPALDVQRKSFGALRREWKF